MSYLLKMPTLCIAAFIALAGSTANAGAAQNNGFAEQTEAYGMMAATFFTAVAATEACGKNPRYKNESEETTRNYLNANQNLFVNITRKLSDAAVRNGGERQREKIAAEFKEVISFVQSESRNKAEGMIVNKDSCTNILANIRSGVMDLKTRHRNQLGLFRD